MGIDLGFTDKSLARSKYAHCASMRRRVAAVYRPPEPDKADGLAPYRDSHEFLNLTRVSMESPDLYQTAVDRGSLLPFERELVWTERTRNRFEDPGLVKRLQAYVESKADPWVRIDRVPADLGKRLVARAKEDHKLSVWDAMPFEEQVDRYCKGCPIRPLDEKNCYLRFSSYPGMNDFREGFLIALLYTSTIDDKRLKNAWFSFAHLDRQKGELPKDKIAELYANLEGTMVNKKPEEFFNQVAGMVQKMTSEDLHQETEEINLGEAPFVDEFVSAFLYREKPYTPEEARKYLPYFETMREVADWAIWDANNAEVRHRLINYRERMDTLVTALQFGDKYNLDTFVSY